MKEQKETEKNELKEKERSRIGQKKERKNTGQTNS